MGFHGWATVSKPYITKRQSLGWSGVKHAATGLYSSGDVLSGVINHASPFGNPMDESEFGSCKENGTDYIVASVKFGGGRIMVWGLGFSSFLFLHNCASVHKVGSTMRDLTSDLTEHLYTCKGLANIILNPMIFKWDDVLFFSLDHEKWFKKVIKEVIYIHSEWPSLSRH